MSNEKKKNAQKLYSKNVDLSGQELTHVIIGQIKELKIETLILDRITYADAGIIDALLDLIANNQIETLSLKFNQFSPLVIKKIIDKLQHHKTLRVLDLYGTRIDPISAQELLQQLTDNNLSIEKINLTLSQPDTMVMIALVEFNQRPVALWKLKLEELYQQLAELLQKLDRSIDKNDSVVFSWIIDQAQKTYRNYEAGIVGADLLQPMRLTLSILKKLQYSDGLIQDCLAKIDIIAALFDKAIDKLPEKVFIGLLEHTRILLSEIADCISKVGLNALPSNMENLLKLIEYHILQSGQSESMLTTALKIMAAMPRNDAKLVNEVNRISMILLKKLPKDYPMTSALFVRHFFAVLPAVVLESGEYESQELSSVESLLFITKFLLQNPRLKSLSLALSGKMTTQQISELFELLRTNHGVHSLDLRALPIETDQQEELLSKLMECNTPVRQIVLPEVEEKDTKRTRKALIQFGRWVRQKKTYQESFSILKKIMSIFKQDGKLSDIEEEIAKYENQSNTKSCAYLYDLVFSRLIFENLNNSEKDFTVVADAFVKQYALVLLEDFYANDQKNLMQTNIRKISDLLTVIESNHFVIASHHQILDSGFRAVMEFHKKHDKEMDDLNYVLETTKKIIVKSSDVEKMEIFYVGVLQKKMLLLVEKIDSQKQPAPGFFAKSIPPFPVEGTKIKIQESNADLKKILSVVSEILKYCKNYLPQSEITAELSKSSDQIGEILNSQASCENKAGPYKTEIENWLYNYLGRHSKIDLERWQQSPGGTSDSFEIEVDSSNNTKNESNFS